MTSITVDELDAIWDEVGLYRNQVLNAEEKPKGSFTSYDYASRYDVSVTKAKGDLAKLVMAGKLKKTMIKVKNAWVPHYTAVKSESCPPSQNGRKRKTKP